MDVEAVDELKEEEGMVLVEAADDAVDDVIASVIRAAELLLEA